jgi:hypothetical protein
MVQVLLLKVNWRWNARRARIQIEICRKGGNLRDLFCVFYNSMIRSELNSCRFLYTQFLAVDANFKLKGKDRGIKDLELMPGWASFVEDGRYHEHIAQYVDQPEVRVTTAIPLINSSCANRLTRVNQSMMLLSELRSGAHPGIV